MRDWVLVAVDPSTDSTSDDMSHIHSIGTDTVYAML